MSVFLYILVFGVGQPVEFRAQAPSWETCLQAARAIRNDNVSAWCHKEQ